MMDLSCTGYTYKHKYIAVAILAQIFLAAHRAQGLRVAAERFVILDFQNHKPHLVQQCVTRALQLLAFEVSPLDRNRSEQVTVCRLICIARLQFERKACHTEKQRQKHSLLVEVLC